MAEEVYRIDITVNFNDQYKDELKQAEREVTKFEKSVERTEKRLERTSRSRWRITLDAVDRASRTIQRVGDFADRTARRSYRLTIGVVDFATRPLRAIGRLATSTLGLLGAGAGIAGGIVWPTKLADDLTTAQIAFETMLGSAQKANQFMEEIYEFAKATPFGRAEVVNLAKNLLVRGFRENEVIPMLERIGNVTAAMGTGAEGIDRIIYALGQMRALGRVSAEDMNQLTDAGVRAWQYLADGMGKSIAEVRKLSEDGKIQADEAIKHILAGMKEFDGMMQNVSNRTLRGLLSQIMDVFEADIFTSWGTGIQKEAVPALREIRNWFDKNEQVTSAWSKAMEEAGSTATRFVVDGVRWIQREMSALVNSREWQEASGPFEKMSLAFDRFTSPFREWWNETGKKEVEEIASKIGGGIGGGLGAFITSALGAEVEGGEGNVFVQAGATAGKKFMEGFMEELHAGEIVKRLLGLFRDIQPTFLGGQNQSMLGSAAALMLDAWIASRLIRLSQGPRRWIKGGWQAGKEIFNWAGEARRGGPSGPLAGSPLLPNVPRASKETIGIFERIRNFLKGFGGPPFGGPPTFSGFGAAGRIPFLGTGLNLLGLLSTPAEQMPQAIGGIAGGMAGSAIGATIGSIFPGVGTAIGGVAGGFLGSMLGEKIGANIDNIKQTVSNKFAEIRGTVEEKMSDLPEKISGWWSDIHSSISSWAKSAYETVASWFGGIPDLIGGAFERAREAWGGFRSWVSEKWRRFTGQDEPKPYASGGLVNRPHLGLVGEAGPEMIIPLSPSRRSRGLELWEQAGRYLGVRQYADGGIVPMTPQPTSTAGGNTYVSMGNIQVTVHVGGGKMNDTKSLAREMADDIAFELAVALQKVSKNMIIIKPE